MSVKNDYREMYQLIEQMNDMLKILEDMMDQTITDTYHLPISVKDELSTISMIELEKKTTEQMMIYAKNLLGIEEFDKFLEERGSIEEVVAAILDIKRTMVEYEDTLKQKNGLLKQADQASEDYIKYVNSPEYKQKKRDHLNELRKKADAETNPYKKNIMIKKIDAIESSWSLSFIFERFEKIGKKEVEAIKNAFFDSKKSSYILSKFENKLKSSGYKKDSYKLLFNIEEMFLPESYRPFNNLYLFVMARFVAYADISSEIDKMYIQAIFINTINLVYHNFQSGEDETKMIGIIKGIDDLFEEWRDFFVENNSTSPDHPRRIEMEGIRERNLILGKLMEANIEFDSSQSTDSLKKLYQEKVVEAAIENEESEKKEVLPALKLTNASEVEINDGFELKDAKAPDDGLGEGQIYAVDAETGEAFPLDMDEGDEDAATDWEYFEEFNSKE